MSSSATDPTWLSTVHVLAWPVVAIAGIAAVLSPPGRAFLDPLLQRLKGVTALGVTLDFTEAAAAKVRQSLEDVFKTYRRDTQDYFDRLSRQYKIAFYRDKLVNDQFLPALTGPAKNDFRCTVHVQDLLFAEALYQLLDYGPIGEGRGRAFPVRFGILGRTWRSGESQSQGEVSTKPGDLIVEWGMTPDEAAAAGRGRQSFACVLLKDTDKAQLGILYLDSMQKNAFGSTPARQAEFLRKTEKQCSEVGLTAALAKLVADTLKRGPEIRIFDKA